MLSGKIPTKTRRAVYEREGYACALCERTGTLHIHHACPRSAGGTNTLGNLIALCPTCHAIAHGEYELANQFPFNRAEAIYAIIHYLSEYMSTLT
jgi:5-methylcytosine-specific restriction endonuclease McrA